MGTRVGLEAAMGGAIISTDEVEALRSENERLKRELERSKGREFKARDLDFLGEVVRGDDLAEVVNGGKLTAKGAKSRDVGMHGDGDGLWLQVTEGGRSWVFRYRRAGRAREMGLGSFSEVSLAEARARGFICRRLLRSGVDPLDRRRSLALASPPPNKRTTFRQAAERFYDSKKAGWRSDKHAIQFPNTMRDYVYPVVGDWPVADVDVNAVMKILEPIWTTKPETASRVRARIELVLDWASALKMRQGTNPAAWRGNLKALLPQRSKVKAVKHHAALPWQEMSAFWCSIGDRKSASIEALRFVITTAARSGEVIGARFSEINLVEKSWTIPPERMKAGRQHRVALSIEAIAVVERMLPLNRDNDSFIFPGAKEGAPLSGMAMAMALRKLGRPDLTVHGFRSTFRDWAAESTSYPGDMVEMALAHTVGNKVEAAYRRGDMFERRRRLMEDWAKYFTRPPNESEVPVGNVTPIRAAGA